MCTHAHTSFPLSPVGSHMLPRQRTGTCGRAPGVQPKGVDGVHIWVRPRPHMCTRLNPPHMHAHTCAAANTCNAACAPCSSPYAFRTCAHAAPGRYRRGQDEYMLCFTSYPKHMIERQHRYCRMEQGMFPRTVKENRSGKNWKFDLYSSLFLFISLFSWWWHTYTSI